MTTKEELYEALFNQMTDNGINGGVAMHLCTAIVGNIPPTILADKSEVRLLMLRLHDTFETVSQTF